MNPSGTIEKQGRRCLFLIGFLWSLGALAEARATILAHLEGPADGQPIAGVGIIRGWAFSDTAGVTISHVTLLIEGTVATAIPCCSERGDVADMLPQHSFDIVG